MQIAGPRKSGGATRAIAFGILAFVVYMANGRPIATGDSLPARWLPFGVLGYGTLLLDPVREYVRDSHEGLLVSPGRGLLIYSPFFLWLFVAPPWRGHAFPRLLVTALIGVALLTVFYAAADWRAGFSYGARFLVDAVPVLVWALAATVARLRYPYVFAVAVAMAIAVQANGAFKYAGQSDVVLFAPDQTHRFQNAWDPTFSPILREAREPFAAMTLLDELKRVW